MPAGPATLLLMYISPILILFAVAGTVALWLVRRRFKLPGVAIAIGVFVLTALGAVLMPPLATPAERSLAWELATGFGGPAFDRAASQTTTVIPVVVDWPLCDSGDWLASPAIVYTPWSVTITMSTTEAFAARNGQVGWCLSGKYVKVQLSEPLGGRALFDGSTFPAQSR
jgi:hypothetical protein